MITRALKFQVGDSVSFPRGKGDITKIGQMTADGKHLAIVYKVERQYWFDWQLAKWRPSRVLEEDHDG